MVKTKLSTINMILQKPLFLLLIILLIIIIIMVVYQYFVDQQIKNIIEKFRPDDLDECDTSNGNKKVNNVCICLKNKDENDKFESSKENCTDFNSLTHCQKELCKGENFTPNEKNCNNINNYLITTNKKDCCDNFFNSIRDNDKAMCIDYDKTKYCTDENAKYTDFNRNCCIALSDENKAKFCKAECITKKKECNELPTEEGKKSCMQTYYYNDTDLKCATYDKKI